MTALLNTMPNIWELNGKIIVSKSLSIVSYCLKFEIYI